MPDLLSEMWREIADRPSGPFAVRFYLQPAVALFLALRDGIKDAHEGRPPYFWAIFTNRPQRRELLRDGWHSIGKVFLVALGIDIVYQIAVLKGLRPVEGVLIATLLAIVPYLLLRGPVNRLLRRRRERHAV